MGFSVSRYEQDVRRIIASGFLTEGEFVRKFEGLVEERYKMGACAVNSCGSGLFTVLRAIPKGATGRLLASNNTFFATGAMAWEAEWALKTLDVAPGEFGMDPVAVATHIHEVDGVILTHVGGALDMNYREIADICKKKGKFLIEDAAHAFGTVNEDGLQAGDLGYAAVFSFYPTKAIPVGEGGCIVSKSPSLIEECRKFRNYGKYQNTETGDLEYMGFGFNFRMDEWTAAVACQQVERTDEIIASRARGAEALMSEFSIHPYFDDRPTNWYKFVTDEPMENVRQSGKVYHSSDQLIASLYGIHDLEKHKELFPNSLAISEGHQCFPVDAGFYDDMSSADICKWVRKEI